MPGARGEIAPDMRDLLGMTKRDLVDECARLRITVRILRSVLDARGIPHPEVPLVIAESEANAPAAGESTVR